MTGQICNLGKSGIKLKKDKGVTLIELLIALVISGILVAALYRTFISQQRTYSVQEQVADMQQNLRVAIDRMTRDIRMAGYGGNILAVFGNINTFTNIITPAADSITIMMADEVGVLQQAAPEGTNQLKVTNANIFNTGAKQYLCLNGENNYVVGGVSGSTITLSSVLLEDHLINEAVYLVKAITYDLGLSGGKPALRRNENTGGGAQPVAENIESLQFTYLDANGYVTASPPDIRMVKVAVTARTNMSDPDYKGGDGFRRRTLSFYIKVRNIGL
jgi:prepilin-type N-terminal cleavage/methylation domain-containing protein